MPSKKTYDMSKTNPNKRKVTEGLRRIQVETVAKGATKCYGKIKKVAWTGSFGKQAFVNFSVGGEVSYSYSATYTFTGHPESSKMNCRAYRVRFDGWTGSYKQQKQLWMMGFPEDTYIKTEATLSGKFKEPCVAYDYYEDLLIK